MFLWRFSTKTNNVSLQKGFKKIKIKMKRYFTYQLPTLTESNPPIIEITFIDPNGKKLDHKIEETLKQGFVFDSTENQEGFYEICFSVSSKTTKFFFIFFF